MHTLKLFRRNTLLAGCIAALWSLALQAAPQPGEQPVPPECVMPQPAVSAPGFGERGRGMEESSLPQPGFLHGLALSEVQRDEVFMILHDQMPEVRNKRRAIRVAQDQLRALAASSQYDEAKVRALAETASRAMLELSLLHARSDQRIYALLTPVQRKQVDEMKSRPDAPAGKGMPGQHPAMPVGRPDAPAR